MSTGQPEPPAPSPRSERRDRMAGPAMTDCIQTLVGPLGAAHGSFRIPLFSFPARRQCRNVSSGLSGRFDRRHCAGPQLRCLRHQGRSGIVAGETGLPQQFEPTLRHVGLFLNQPQLRHEVGSRARPDVSRVPSVLIPFSSGRDSHRPPVRETSFSRSCTDRCARFPLSSEVHSLLTPLPPVTVPSSIAQPIVAGCPKTSDQ